MFKLKMVKITQTKTTAFKLVTIVLETQKEFDHVLGLFNGADTIQKQNCDDFDTKIDDDIWDKLDDIKDTQ